MKLVDMVKVQPVNEVSYSTLKRMDGLVNRTQLGRLDTAIQTIARDLMDEGFEIDEIVDYIEDKVDGFVNKA